MDPMAIALEEARLAVIAGIEGTVDEEGSTDFETLKRRARSALGKFVNERTRRRPMIVPVVIEV